MELSTQISWQELVSFIFGIAFVWYEIKSLRRDIHRLEKKQDKYNTLQDRVHTLELWREFHEREMENAK